MSGTGVRPAFARGLALLAAIALGGAGLACKTDAGKPSPGSGGATAPVVTIDTGGRKVSFRVEVARTPEEHERGLMWREHLDADAGMLFVFDEPREQVFWMKNTLIPLDMIFIARDGRILGIVESAVPRTETARRVAGLSQYVLEIGGGQSAKQGIRAGQLIELQSVPAPAP
jgi:uncharacterized membrane protein (UPF0127 family)